MSDVTSFLSSAFGLILHRASFRGASFHVEQSTSASGRRTAAHEYPGRDVPFTEDLGRKQGHYQFNAYCIGSLYRLQRDRLWRACTQKGPGTLVHPAFGSLQVICSEVSVQEERQSGNYCQFSLAFLEAGQLREPGTASTGIGGGFLSGVFSGIGDAINGAVSAVSDAFQEVWDTTGLGDFLNESAVQDVLHFTDVMGAVAMSPIVGGAFGSSLARLGATATSVVGSAANLFDGVSAVTTAFGEGSSATSAFSSMLSVGTGFLSHTSGLNTLVDGIGLILPHSMTVAPATPLTPSRAQELRNGQAFQSLVRQLALVEVAYAVPGLDIASAQEAADIRNGVINAFEAEQVVVANAGQDELYAALVELQNVLIRDITTRMLQLPALTTYTLPQSLNSLALAWRLYQDAQRGDELVDRTAAINPAFLPRTGRVLSS